VVLVEVEGADEEGVRAVVAKAEQTCLVAVSVDLPVSTTVEVRTGPGAVEGTAAA
jgi:organic hydroperoxide reductase OsmC/OhrA